MARSRTSKARGPLRKLRPRPLAGPEQGAFDDVVVEQLTGDILQHLSAANSHSVSVRAEVGRLLLRVRAELPHGSFLPWLRDHVPFTPATAERAMNLHRFAEKQPTLFDFLKPLGVSKANVLINLPTDRLSALVHNAHVVPSSGATKTLHAMTFSEMMELIAENADDADGESAAAAVRRYRGAARRLIRSLDALVDQHPNVDSEAIAEIYDELIFTISRFGATFELDIE